MKENLTFEFLGSINKDYVDIMTPENERLYVPYLINHFLGGTIDTLLYASRMNGARHLDNRLQYDYLRFSVRKKFRRSKWLKNENLDKIKMVQKYYNCSPKKANDALRILSQDELDQIEQYLKGEGVEDLI